MQMKSPQEIRREYWQRLERINMAPKGGRNVFVYLLERLLLKHLSVEIKPVNERDYGVFLLFNGKLISMDFIRGGRYD